MVVGTQVLPSEVTDSLEPLKGQILAHFKTKTLAKGFNEVLTSIRLHRALKIYICGALDPMFMKKFQGQLQAVSCPRTRVTYLPAPAKRLVYDSIKDTVNPHKKTPLKPKRYFNTRIFAFIGTTET